MSHRNSPRFRSNDPQFNPIDSANPIVARLRRLVEPMATTLRPIHGPFPRRLLGVLVTCACFLWFGQGVTNAQPGLPLNPSPIAVAGEPFGVVSIEIPLPEKWDGHEPRVLIREGSDRIFYPAINVHYVDVDLPQAPLPPPLRVRPGGLIDRLRQVIRRPPGKKSIPVAIKIDALFRGRDPLAIQVVGDLNQKVDLPTSNEFSADLHRKYLNQWWQAYTQQAARFVHQQGSPKGIHQYLVAMLGSRFGLPTVNMDEPTAQPAAEKLNLQETLELIAPPQKVKNEIYAQVLQGMPPSSSPLQPMPDAPTWETTQIPHVETEVEIEPLAARIPTECFYLRFGSFSNYIWFQEIGSRLAQEISSAIEPQGMDYGGTSRLERMLGTRTTTVSKMFGDQLIKDMALFGTDMYFGDGASMGVLFLSTNPALLKVSFQSDRKSILKEYPDATLTDLDIAGKQVSLLSTPDNRIRSFMVVDGPFVLVTTSLHLVERFLATSELNESLASSETFRWVRNKMPASNGYSVFGYFPPEFFQNLLGPHYQIELRRRLQAASHIEIAEIASRLALSEFANSDGGQDLAENLIAMHDAGLLPPHFDTRPDTAQLVRSGDRWIDSLRGARGSFIPIADVPTLNVTADEAAEYSQIAAYFQQNWQRMDPLFFGVRRFEGDQVGQEQFSIEAVLAPFEPAKYGWITEQLAAPSPIAIAFPKDDLVAIQARVRGMSAEDSYYLFGGLKDMLPPDPEDVRGLIPGLRAMKSAPAYLGAWPKPDLIELLPFGIGAKMGAPDVRGYSRVLGGLWRWQDDQWSLLSFHKDILDSASNQIALNESPDVAQVRATIGDLTNTQLAVWANRTWWERGWQSSHANAELLDAIDQQLHVLPSECLATVERVTGGQLQCALGGQFEFTASHPARWWTSSAWQHGEFSDQGKPRPPSSYSAPWLQWFRGATIHATHQPGSLAIVGLMHTSLPASQPAHHNETQPQPSDATQTDLKPKKDFNVFDLPSKMFGNKNKPSKPEPKPPSSTRREF